MKMCTQMNQSLNWFVALVGFLALGGQLASAWHAYDVLDTTSGRSTFNDYFNRQQPLQPFAMSHNFYNSPQFYTNPTVANQQQQQQLLTPSTLSSQNAEALPSLLPEIRETMVQAPPPPPPASPTGEQVSEIVPRDVSAQLSRPTSAPATELPISSVQPLEQQLESRQNVAPPTISEVPAITQSSSPLPPMGKILDAVFQLNTSATTSTTIRPLVTNNNKKQSSGTEAVDQPLRQVLLKPRKSNGEHSKSPLAMEQQIIDQHARAAAGYSPVSQYSSSSDHSQAQPQQRLLPTTKQRDKSSSSLSSSSSSLSSSLGSKLIQTLGAAVQSSALAASASANGDVHNSNSSPIVLSQLFDNFKSGITSRSSIVKAAISDNKLARTLTSVSKSIGGNKYVAGAGLAAALAALGLTVGKFLTPYVASSSNQYSKFAEPLMTSSSFSMPSAYNNERNFIYSGGLPVANSYYNQIPASASMSPDSMLTSATNGLPARDQMFDQMSTSHYSMEPATMSQQFDPSTLAQMASAVGLYPASQHSVVSQNGAGGGFSISNNYLRPSTSSSSSSSKMPLDTNNGHYANFYSTNQQTESAQELPSEVPQQFVTYNVQPQQQPQQQQQQQQPQQYGTYISGTPMSQSGNRAETFDSSSSSSSPQSNSYGGNLYSDVASEQQQQQPDQIMSAASAESPTYQRLPATGNQQQQQQSRFNPMPAQTPRRSGAVLLKLDESNLTAKSYSASSYSAPAGKQQQPSGTQQLISMTSSSTLPTDYQQQQQRQWSTATLGQINNKLPSGKLSRFEIGAEPMSAAATTMTMISNRANQAHEGGQLPPQAHHQMDLSASSGYFQKQQQKWMNDSTQQPSYTLIRPNSIASRDFTTSPAAAAITTVTAKAPAKVPAVIHHRAQSSASSSNGWISVPMADIQEVTDEQQQQPETTTSVAQQVPQVVSTVATEGDNGVQKQHVRVSRTPPETTTTTTQDIAADGDKLAREQFNQLATLIDARRASMKRASQLLSQDKQTDKHATTNAGVTNSIKNKSETSDNKSSNEVNMEENNNDNNNDQSAQRQQQQQDENSMQANISVGQRQLQTTGDNVVVEFVDGGDIVVVEDGPAQLDNKSQQRQHSQSTSSMTKSTTGDDGDDEDNASTYRRLVAGSIGGGSSNSAAN